MRASPGHGLSLAAASTTPNPTSAGWVFSILLPIRLTYLVPAQLRRLPP